MGKRKASIQFASSFAGVGLVAISLAACTPSAEQSPDLRSGPQTMKNTAAERSMPAFDAANPRCELWTNWQQVCSRTGDDGSTLCSQAEEVVAPSTPFCVAERGGGYKGLLPTATEAERKSFNRYCLRYGDGTEVPPNVCREWKADRPFNNLRLAEIKHPWCKQWSLAVDPAVNAELSATNGYYCSSREIPAWCEWTDGLGIGPQIDDPPPVKDSIIIPVGSPIPSYRAVNFPHCRRKSG